MEQESRHERGRGRRREEEVRRRRKEKVVKTLERWPWEEKDLMESTRE